VKAPLPERWSRLWQAVAAQGDPVPVLQELLSLYSQPHRYYHNLDHIKECLAEFDAVRHLARQPVAVELAIWFHDAIYEPRAADNEERSAEFAQRHLARAGASAELCAAVAGLVLATKAHDPSAQEDAPLLIDLDLSILGQPAERFWQYESQVRREYEWVPEITFAARRAEILERFLAREKIYSTGEFFRKYEARARRNLESSIRKLRRQPSEI